MIAGKCVIHVDGYENYAWPERFVAVPRKGEFMMSIQKEGQSQVSRRVAAVYHTMGGADGASVGESWPRILVVLY